MKILIIEDEQQLITSVIKYLKKEYFICETVSSIDEANEKLLSLVYDCIILDITLPDGNGLNLLRSLREDRRKDGVIIISARHSIEDKILGFKLGADDYLPKPFHLAELSARIGAIIRRKQFDGHQHLEIDGLVLDFDAKTVFYEDKQIELTKTEFDLLVFLVSNRNRVVTKKAIAVHISGDQAETVDNFFYVYTHLKNLKRKLVNSGCVDRIKSVYGIGYKFEQ
jgi:DNA-binding response OmpR family regulator